MCVHVALSPRLHTVKHLESYPRPSPCSITISDVYRSPMSTDGPTPWEKEEVGGGRFLGLISLNEQMCM